ncbi:hypothetical protein [Phaeobacter gallaeciensis]|uniref:Uncharacterized protein n=1 Tax=Phaeobacter gallaeciensis TaxID=60890 RepID=A0AAC9Z7X2_9RHOB|nr:hypothetical protein [Phaeobacter gallaeciensis]AHD09162.1 hypothetical protein Gal_01400 [Phaeobacter gallaeciensis DSM 26640]ATE92425.1 hypothetical protein PhaeoP11_01391 [Phaeobacter gallaeciensis]ATE97753.1 hypothetical protein PhaeoP73_02455 [Phaeobacter gallaeciensis]ATF01090.1 hypothetical protein PhaeoP75_01441 [Phaeobacter gallaeciensis]ATF05470.1 hypothetical protein PhaeoP63_01389 [Phaeobacter gallaeciensis]
MQKTLSRHRIKSMMASVRLVGSWLAGQRIPYRGKIAGHAEMDLPKKVGLESIIQSFQCFAGGSHIQWVSGFQRTINGIATALIDIFGAVANIFERLEKTEIGRICHRICLFLQKSALIYRGCL